MKTKTFFTVALLTISLLSAQAQSNDMFQRLSAHQDVTSVYISRALLSWIMPNLSSHTGRAEVDVQSLARKLEQVEIHNSNGNAEANRIIREEVASLADSGTYKVVMRMREGNNNIVFYARTEGNYFRDLIMHIEETNNSTIIRIMGAFTVEDIRNVGTASAIRVAASGIPRLYRDNE